MCRLQKKVTFYTTPLKTTHRLERIQTGKNICPNKFFFMTECAKKAGWPYLRFWVLAVTFYSMLNAALPLTMALPGRLACWLVGVCPLMDDMGGCGPPDITCCMPCCPPSGAPCGLPSGTPCCPAGAIPCIVPCPISARRFISAWPGIHGCW